MELELPIADTRRQIRISLSDEYDMLGVVIGRVQALEDARRALRRDPARALEILRGLGLLKPAGETRGMP